MNSEDNTTSLSDNNIKHKHEQFSQIFLFFSYLIEFLLFVQGVAALYSGIKNGLEIFSLLFSIFLFVAAGILFYSVKFIKVKNKRWHSITKLLFWSASITTLGYLGIRLCILLFPESNLLGGFALIFGPIYVLGLLMIIFSEIVWIINLNKKNDTSS